MSLSTSQRTVLGQIVDANTGKGRRGINPAGVSELASSTVTALIRKGLAVFTFLNVGRGGIARVKFLRPTSEGREIFA